MQRLLMLREVGCLFEGQSARCAGVLPLVQMNLRRVTSQAVVEGKFLAADGTGVLPRLLVDTSNMLPQVSFVGEHTRAPWALVSLPRR